AHQSGHGGHHDGTEANQSTLVNGFLRALTFVALSVEREVDHHDGVLFHDTDQHDDSHEGVQVQFLVEDEQGEQCADTGRRQAGKNRDGVHKAFVKNSQDDVDHKDGGDQQQSQSDERTLKCLCSSLESTLHVNRQNLVRYLIHELGRIAESHARFQIEA